MSGTDPTAVDSLPLIIGGCRRIAELGRGGMGTVFRARQLSMDRDVALKVIHPAHAADRVASERFVREIRSAGAVNCPQLVSCHDAGTDRGILFLIMELIVGGDAGQLIRRDGALGPEQAVAIIRHAACGAQALHAAGLLHRDIKPSNIFLTDTGAAKLADLGLARRLVEEQPVTLTGAMVGTPAFMSPEQALGEEVDERTDTYALGATLYALLTGRAPFIAGSPLAVAASVISGPFPDPRSIVPGIPPALAALVLHACARRREERPRDAAGFLAALDHALLAPASAPRRPTAPAARPAPRRRAWAWIAAAVVLLAGAAAWAWRADGGRTPVEPVGAATTPPAGPSDRRQLDPLLRIVSGRHLPLACLQAFASAAELPTLATDLRGQTLVARQLAGRTEVIATHPVKQDTPARIDFSAITADRTGVLKLSLRGHDRGLCRAILLRDGREVERISLRHGVWIERDLPFDRQPVVIVHEADGWVMAFLALTYRVEAGALRP